MVNFEWYRTFKAIYETGTLTGAARELLISQPNVSQHLSSLEAYTGKKLFERKPRLMVPTEYGKLFYTEIIDAVEKLEHVETDFRYTYTHKKTPLTCIGSPRELFYTLLAEHIQQADAEIVIRFGSQKELLQKLLKEETAFMISSQKIEDKKLGCEPLFKETFLLIANADMDISRFKKLISAGMMEQAEDWLRQKNWYTDSSDLLVIRNFWLKNFNKRPLLKPRFVIPDYNAILKSISHGEGVTIVADYLVRELIRQKKLKELWKGIAPTTNTLYLLYDKSRIEKDQLELVRKLVTTK